MHSGRSTVLTSRAEEIGTEHACIAVDGIELVKGEDNDDGQPLEKKHWSDADPKLVTVRVRLDQMRPMQGTLDVDASCWIVRT